MTGFGILDLVIGIVFIFFILSLMCAALQEIRASFFNLRAENLKNWVLDVFQKKFGSDLMKNILIDGLTRNGQSASYLPKEVFTRALLDQVHIDGCPKDCDLKTHLLTPYTMISLKSCLKDSPNLPDNMKQALVQMHSESFSNLEHFKLRIGEWFEQAMERNTETFKKDAQKWVFIYSIVITILMNVDALKLVRYFYETPTAAEAVANAAEQTVKDEATINTVKTIIAADTVDNKKELTEAIVVLTDNIREIKQYKDMLEGFQLPIGWDMSRYKNAMSGDGKCFVFWLLTVCGWAVTCLAVSLGAPFWFDMLNKLVNLRSSGKKPEDKAADKITNTDGALA